MSDKIREAFEAWIASVDKRRDANGWEPLTARDVNMLREGYMEVALAQQPAPAVQEQVEIKLGIYGAAFDGPSTRRAYTYSHQPGKGNRFLVLNQGFYADIHIKRLTSAFRVVIIDSQHIKESCYD